MSDIFEGRTMTEAFKFISAGTAHTFTFGFQPDKVTFYNLTTWTATAAGKPISVWFRGQTTADYAFQEQVIDSSAGASFNFLNTAADGFTVANTTGGPDSTGRIIAGVTQADPCVVTTTTDHNFQTGQTVRFSDLGSSMPVLRGMDQLDGKKYNIVVLSATEFSLVDILSGVPVDSTAFTAWVAGGRVQLETNVLELNNPPAGAYTSNPYFYKPVVYKLTAGTAVMGSNSDVYLIEVIKYGNVTDLGDLLV